jgi:hypothetical protein
MDNVCPGQNLKQRRKKNARESLHNNGKSPGPNCKKTAKEHGNQNDLDNQPRI